MLATLEAPVFPEEFWDVQDDACNCTFQRIGMWTNPYLGETLEVRMCCIWEKLYELFPGMVRKTPAFFDYNANEWNPEVREWDGEDDMPRSIWYRQLSKMTGRHLDDVREEYGRDEPPKGTPRPRPEPTEVPNTTEMLLAMVNHLAERLEALEAK